MITSIKDLTIAVVGATGAAIAVVFHLHGEPELSETASWVASVSGVLLLGSMWRQSRRQR